VNANCCVEESNQTYHAIRFFVVLYRNEAFTRKKFNNLPPEKGNSERISNVLQNFNSLLKTDQIFSQI